MNDYIKELYYDEFPSYNELYKRVKEKYPEITHSKLKNYLNTLEENQLYKQRHIKKHFHLSSYYPFSRLQIDLLDLKNYIPRKNDGYRYLFICIDTYTRYVLAIPLKTKSEEELFKALNETLNYIFEEGYYVSQIDSDNESGFNSSSIVNLCKRYGIKQNFNKVGDHRALGIIDRFSRTIREMLNRYTSSRNTNKWINVISNLINIYNSRNHSSLDKSPTDAITDNSYWEDEKEENNAEASKQLYHKQEINVGSKVRLLKKRNIFDKGTNEKWTREVFKITEYKNGLYYVDGREGGYKKNELQLINDVVKYQEQDDNKAESERKEERTERRINRGLRKEGIERNDAIERPKRARKERDTGFSIKY